SYADVCSDFDHLEVRLSASSGPNGEENWQTEWSSYQQVNLWNKDILLSYELRAIDKSGKEMEGLETSVSYTTCTVSSGKISLPQSANICEVDFTSECGGKATVQLLASPTPSPPSSCNLEGISEVKLSPSSLELYPDETAEVVAKFYDQDGNELSEEDLSARNLTGDFNGEFFQIQNGGGVITSQNSENFSAQIKAGQTPGTYKDTIVFSACSGQLKAYADLVVERKEDGEETFCLQVEPSEIHLEPNETRTFSAKAFAPSQEEITSQCEFSWELKKKEAGTLSTTSGSQVNFTASKKEGYYGEAIKVSARCGKAQTFTYVSVGIKRLSAQTPWLLKPSFDHLNALKGERVRIYFLPFVIFRGTPHYIYSDKIKPRIRVREEVGKIVAKGDNWIEFIPEKEGCYHNLFEGSFSWYGTNYSAFASLNVGSNNPFSAYAKFQPKISSLYISPQHIKPGETVRLKLKAFDDLGHSIPIARVCSASSPWPSLPISYRFILNDGSLGSLSEDGYLEVNPSLSPRTLKGAITVQLQYGEQQITRTFDIEIISPATEITRQLTLPGRTYVIPNEVFLLQNPVGIYRTSLGDYEDGYVEVGTAEGTESYQPFAPYFSVSKEGKFEKGLILRSSWSNEQKEVQIWASEKMQTDYCRGTVVCGSYCESEEKEETALAKRITFPPQVGGGIVYLFAQPPSPWFWPLISFVVSLPFWLAPLNYLRLLDFLWRLFALGKKAPKKGVVFDAGTKKPLPLARVLVFRFPDAKLVYQTFSNSLGEFILPFKPGNYFLRVQKGAFKPQHFIPSSSKRVFRAGRTDGYYDNLYYPEEILAWEEEGTSALLLSVPMSGEKRENWWMKLTAFWQRVYLLWLLLGSALLALALWLAPFSWLNLLLLGYYLILWAEVLYRYLWQSSGAIEIRDEQGNPVDLALVRIQDLKGNTVFAGVSDREGKVWVNINPGRYVV
ncbi:carboxypeptidase regulatory-like domain-containing protein, partial [bacterium]|nr:carboxypeptidase regulatory-like domain-containing protein [bacterium]